MRYAWMMMVMGVVLTGCSGRQDVADIAPAAGFGFNGERGPDLPAVPTPNVQTRPL